MRMASPSCVRAGSIARIHGQHTTTLRSRTCCIVHVCTTIPQAPWGKVYMGQFVYYHPQNPDEDTALLHVALLQVIYLIPVP
jgi:hypothetical protein